MVDTDEVGFIDAFGLGVFVAARRIERLHDAVLTLDTSGRGLLAVLRLGQLGPAFTITSANRQYDRQLRHD